MGSSHGLSRIIRLSYHEGEQYNPMLRSSYALWEQLEQQIGQELYLKTGYMDISPATHSADGVYSLFERSLAGALKYGIPHQVLTAQQVNTRFPAFRLLPNFMALLQPDGGILPPEKCTSAHLSLAQHHGAVVQCGQTVQSWHVDQSTGEVSVSCRGGQMCTARNVILTAGAWIPDVVPELARVCVPQRQVVGWFECSQPELFQPASFPVFALGDETHYYYGFPEYGGAPGFKFGKFLHLHEDCSGDDMDRGVHPRDEQALRAGLRQYFPDADGRLLSSGVCLFTNVPDMHFIIDRHPTHPQVLVCSACSGHGFKMSSAIGERLAQLSVDGETDTDISSFNISRVQNFSSSSTHHLMNHFAERTAD